MHSPRHRDVHILDAIDNNLSMRVHWTTQAKEAVLHEASLARLAFQQFVNEAGSNGAHNKAVGLLVVVQGDLGYGDQHAQETDGGLADALFESERSVPELEQALIDGAVAENFLLNKVVSQQSHPHSHTASEGSRLLLLAFTSFPKTFRDCLLTSELAAKLRKAGVDMEPAWASATDGKIIMAEGVTEEAIADTRGKWKVAVRLCDEDEIHAIRLSMPNSKNRPRPQIEDRFWVPLGTSLFEAASSSSRLGGIDWKYIQTKSTFLQVNPDTPPRMPSASF